MAELAGFMSYAIIRDSLRKERLEKKWATDNFIEFYKNFFHKKQVRIYLDDKKRAYLYIKESQEAVLLYDKDSIPFAKMYMYGASRRYYDESKSIETMIYSMHFKSIKNDEKCNYVFHFCPLYPELSYLSLSRKIRKTKWCIPYNIKSKSCFDISYETSKTFVSVV